MKILFLDDRDIRVRRFMEVCPIGLRRGSLTVAWEITVVRSAMAAIKALLDGPVGTAASYDVIFLDHDLNDQRHGDQVPDRINNGLAVALFLAAWDVPTGKIIIHSTNDGAAQEMLALLLSAGYQAVHMKPDHDDFSPLIQYMEGQVVNPTIIGESSSPTLTQEERP